MEFLNPSGDLMVSSSRVFSSHLGGEVPILLLLDIGDSISHHIGRTHLRPGRKRVPCNAQIEATGGLLAKQGWNEMEDF